MDSNNDLSKNQIFIPSVIQNLLVDFMVFPNFWKEKSVWNASPHFHCYYEFHFIMSGMVDFESAGQRISLERGDVCVVPAGFNHHTIKNKNQIKKSSIMFSLYKVKGCENTNSDLFTISSELYQKLNKIYVLNKNYKYETYILDIVKALSEPDMFSYQIAKGLFNILFLEITKQLAEELKEPIPQAVQSFDIAISEKEQRREQIENYIHSQYMNHISLSDLSEYLHLSEKQTDRILKDVTGVNFGNILLCHRMEIAKDLILSNEFSIEEISRKTGYDSYNGFYYAFKNFYKNSPVNFKKELSL